MSEFAVELYKLRQLSGADFIAQLKVVTARSEFHPLVNEPEIFTAGGEGREDYLNLINAASKAVAQGYRVFILPTQVSFRITKFRGKQRLCKNVYETVFAVTKKSLLRGFNF